MKDNKLSLDCRSPAVYQRVKGHFKYTRQARTPFQVHHALVLRLFLALPSAVLAGAALRLLRCQKKQLFQSFTWRVQSAAPSRYRKATARCVVTVIGVVDMDIVFAVTAAVDCAVVVAADVDHDVCATRVRSVLRSSKPIVATTVGL